MASEETKCLSPCVPRTENNFVLITGLITGKQRNANNADTIRPVLDVEVLFQGEDGQHFEPVTALLSGGPLARSLPGINVGDIYEIGGYVRCDENQGIYVEVTKMVRLREGKKNETVSLGRLKLMEMEMVPNFAMLIGTVTNSLYGLVEVTVERTVLTKGDLRGADKITVDALDAGNPKMGDKVVCIGQLCGSSIFADKILAVKEG